MTQRWGRVLRGLCASGLAVFVAAFAHVAGGGSTPGLAGVALALALSGLAGVAIAGRALSRLRLSATVLLSQLAFHALFGIGAVELGIGAARLDAGAVQSGVGPSAAVDAMGMPGMPGHAAASAGAVGTVIPPLGGGAVMWAAHALAALLTIAALVWGERAVRSLGRSAALAVSRALRFAGLRATTLSADAHPHATHPQHPVAAAVLLSALRHRGPPAAIGAPG
ncbi:hypothetical protein [Galbitalea soli]|uniref:Uncharacterized protein n=1 Tax=Galbitalea soli TaxID=1268042 RepID=A0A7C9TSB8_9MICO|nr:hypothetical protein [Galbitalea soli]NEM92255.1 hypothetical protein [Galbitalea soli]NYJ31789.1 hypothetical protein [Galbitalea soli]